MQVEIHSKNKTLTKRRRIITKLQEIMYISISFVLAVVTILDVLVLIVLRNLNKLTNNVTDCDIIRKPNSFTSGHKLPIFNHRCHTFHQRPTKTKSCTTSSKPKWDFFLFFFTHHFKRAGYGRLAQVPFWSVVEMPQVFDQCRHVNVVVIIKMAKPPVNKTKKSVMVFNDVLLHYRRKNCFILCAEWKILWLANLQKWSPLVTFTCLSDFFKL